jgi:hypothetical protein
MAEIQRPIASFSREKKSDIPLPVQAEPNPEYAASFDEFAGAWAEGETVFFAGRGSDYDRFRGAYEFGAKIAANNHFAEQSWVTAEKQIRADWEKRTRVPWDEVGPEIQRGWNDARGEG